jgi:hypothetical protein
MFSITLWADNFSRSPDSRERYSQGSDNRQYGYQGKYNPWESIIPKEDESEQFESNSKNKLYKYGHEQSEIEWYSEEKMGRKPRIKDEYQSQQRRGYRQQTPPNNTYYPYGGGFGGDNNYYPGRYPGW